jgi:hypothetical protein
MLLGNWRHRRPTEAAVAAEVDADGCDGVTEGLQIYGEKNLPPNA